MRILRSLKSLLRRTYRHLLRRLSKKELIIILSFAVGLILTVAIIVVLKMNAPEKTASDPDDASVDISLESESSEDTAAATDSEEITIVETATAETKVESTEATTVLAEKSGTKNGYMNRCVFLGDSRTVAMVNYGLINDDAALAQIGISHPSFKSNTFINNAGKEYTLKSYLSSHQAPVIYIALGVNGINDPSEEHYKNTFIDLIDNVMTQAPNSNIVLMSIGPVNDNGPYKKTVQNSWIVKYNDFLLNTAKEKHIFYLNFAEILTGADGQVKSEYNGGDGLHYSGSGCQAIFDYIVSHPVPGISDDGEYKVKYIKPNPNRTKVTMDDGSGIDADKLQELMNMMMEATPTATPTATVAPTSEPINTPEPTKTPAPTSTPTPTATPTPRPTPTGNNDNPSGGNDNPSGGNDNPSGGNDNPSGGNDNPSGGNDNPSGGNDNPSGGNDNPSGGNDNPSGGNDNPSGGNDNPSGGDDNPSGGDDNPGGE